MGTIAAYRVLRTLPPIADGAVMEALDVSTDTRVLLWPGRPPTEPLPPHPRFARRGEAVSLSGSQVWVEHCLPGVLLADLSLPLEPGLAAGICGALLPALRALHDAGQAHGDLHAARVAVSPDGRLQLLGSGVVPGQPRDDLTALTLLLAHLSGETAPEPEDDAQALTEWLRRRSEGVPWRVLLRSRLTDLQPVDPATDRVTPVPSLDEVAFEVGPDEQGRGLLDTATGTRSTPGESTSTMDPQARREQTRISAMARLAADLRSLEPPGFVDGAPCRELRELIADEPLDPLPTPNGLPPPRLQATDQTSAEITVVRPSPLLDDALDEALDDPTTAVRPVEVTTTTSLPRTVAASIGAVLVLIGGLLLLALSLK